MTKKIIEFFEDNDRIRFRTIGYVEVTAEMIRCGSPVIEHYYEKDSPISRRKTTRMWSVCPPSLIATTKTEERPNRCFTVLWDRHCDELNLPHGTVLH